LHVTWRSQRTYSRLVDGDRLAVLGIGNPCCGIAVIASLATYFGERPLEVCLYDPDAEFLDIYDRLARLAFKTGKATHHLVASEDEAETLEGSNRVISMLSPRSARIYRKRHGKRFEAELDPVQFAVEDLLTGVEPGAKVLSLQDEGLQYPLGVYRLDCWPDPMEESLIGTVAHQVHRYLLDDEPVYGMLKDQDKSPLKRWLDNPLAAEFVSKRG
jgi:hypothetical protein